MSKFRAILWVLVGFATIITSYGQNVEVKVDGSPYLGITSYNGGLTSGALNVYIEQSYGVNMDIENWKMSVKPITPIVAADGTVFPAEKISFIPISTEGNGVPSVAEIGMPSPVPLHSTMEAFLVPNALVPLKNNGNYYQLKFNFALAAAGGAYLQYLFNATGSWNKYYSATFQFTVYDGNSNVIGARNYTWTNLNVQRLTGAPPPDQNQYSIRVSSEASNGLLEFKTASDYINGKSVTYTNGLTVTATTAYQVTVRSIPAHFSSATGNTLPLDVVRLQLGGGAGTQPQVTLSTSAKTIMQGASTDGVSRGFDIIYSTEANDRRLFNFRSDHYSTSLMYEISPK